MARTRLNPRLTKIHLAYTLAEVAELYSLHVNTVRGWIKRDGLEPIDGGRPILIKGSVLRAFLESRRKKAKHPSPPGHLYCFGCRAPRKPALGMVDYHRRFGRAGNLSALCEVCGTTMHRQAREDALGLILPEVEVRIVEAAPRIAEPDPPPSNCHFKQGAAA